MVHPVVPGSVTKYETSPPPLPVATSKTIGLEMLGTAREEFHVAN